MNRVGGATAARTDATALWAEYEKAHSKKARADLIERYMPLVRSIARKLSKKLPQNVELDDLVSSGIVGLVDAIEKFDRNRHVKFETYCTIRVHGAMIDALREIDWVPRLVRAKAHKLDRAIEGLEADLGREPTNTELAGLLGVSSDELDTLMREAQAVAVVSLSDTLPGEERDERAHPRADTIEDRRDEGPANAAERRDWLDSLLASLLPRERELLILYYLEALPMRDCGLVLGISESRVCQLMARIREKLQRGLLSRPQAKARAARA